MSHPPDSGPQNQQHYQPPSSILVVGAGVFGLSTTLAVLSSPVYARTHVTLVDPDVPNTANQRAGRPHTYTPNPHAASIDSSRIIRSDYANSAYAELATEAQEAWRKGFGGDNVYQESGLVVVAGEGGNEYVEAACRNVEKNSNGNGRLTKPAAAGPRLEDVERLRSPEEVRVALGSKESISPTTKGTEIEQLGTTGYINHSSGWANAERAIRTVFQRITSYGSSRITFRRAEAKQLLFCPSQTAQGNKPTVSGVLLTDNSRLSAELTILATGAWTGSLLDLRGRLQATGQVVAYVPLTAAEAEEMQKMPVFLNLSTGYFVIPPIRNAEAPSTANAHTPSSSCPSPAFTRIEKASGER
ncbi:MAG: hypothetical protein Q9181_003732, partial [Wetmoreana brouardii]